LPGVYIPPHHPNPPPSQQTQMGIWWPAADSAKLRAAARAWKDMAHALDAVEAAGQSAVLNLLADNQGPAMDAFAAYWQKWSGGNGYLPTCSKACTAIASAQESYAQAVDDARVKVEELVAEIGTAVVLGVVLGVCTVGIATAAAGAVTTGLVASAAAVGFTLSETAAGIISGMLVGASFGAVEAMAIDAGAIQPEKVWLFKDQKDFNWSEVWQWAEMGAAGGFIGGGLTASIGAASDVLPTAISDAMATRLGGVVVGGASGAGTSMVMDEFQYGQISPLDVVAGTVGGAAGGGLGRGRPGARDTGPTYKYNMIDDNGPLAVMPENPAGGFAGGRYNVIVLVRDTILYRGGAAGGGRNAFGQWFSFEASTSRAQIRIELAVKPHWIDPATGESLGSSPVESLYAIKVPAGTTVYVGPTSNQGGIYLGGRVQVFVPEPWRIPGIEVLSETPLP
jgi:hypothetical protein